MGATGSTGGEARTSSDPPRWLGDVVPAASAQSAYGSSREACESADGGSHDEGCVSAWGGSHQGYESASGGS